MEKTALVTGAGRGIEDDNDNNMALENKADYLEGFYYGEALTEDEFETKWLK